MRTVWAAIAIAIAAAAPGQEPRNLLRNGAFDGAHAAYWHPPAPEQFSFEPRDGGHCLRITKGYFQSASFRLTPGKAVTVSFGARAVGKPYTIGLQVAPSAREVAAKAGQTWGLRQKHPFKLTTEWQRFTLDFTPTAPQTGLWPEPTYALQIGDADGPILLDDVCVAYGTGEYVPYSPAEAAVTITPEPTYRAGGNLFAHGQAVECRCSTTNRTGKPQRFTLRTQLFDYEGQRPLGPPTDVPHALVAGATWAGPRTFTLEPRGLVLARFSVLDEAGTLLDSSDQPLASLPYPKSPTRPDPAERFGGSFFGLTSAGNGAKIGFGWSRWFPHMNWADHQPKGPGEWTWFDDKLDALAAQGISVNAVLYGKPKWAFASPKDVLPKDLQWPAGDPRWNDLDTLTAWDTFVVEAVKHYRGKSLVYEIENEPELDGWTEAKKEAEYAAFTIRTARLIKRADPTAQVMVDNVYAIPSGLNRKLLEQGAAHIDIVSWHDYHGGGLTDARAVRKMRQNLDGLGGKNVAIWFNEGWAFTNTAVDEPALPLLGMPAWRSTNLMVSSVAEVTAAGQDKTILFHTGYETHGMSYWDYSGPGTMLWDWYGNPLPLAPAWNTLSHHIGKGDRMGIARPPGATVCVFDDRRNGRAVAVVYADGDSKGDATLPIPVAGYAVEDIMGNPVSATGPLTLSKSGRPAYLLGPAGSRGADLFAAFEKLDRKHAGVVADGGKVFTLPLAWDGPSNPYVADGQPVWRLDQCWPDNLAMADHYTPLAWAGTDWQPQKNGAGGQPTVRVENGTAIVSVRGPWGNVPGQRIAGVTFVAPRAGTYTVTGTATSKPWTGDAKALELRVLLKDTQRAAAVKAFPLPRGQAVSFAATVEVSAGNEIVLLPMVPHYHNAATVTLAGVTVTRTGER